MKKILLAFVFGLLIVSRVSLVRAQESSERPKGLEDKGPLTKITFIHYKKESAKPSGAARPKVSPCYGFLAKGAMWKATEDYQIRPTNQDGLNQPFILEAVTRGANTWDNQVAFKIFGNALLNSSAIYRTDIADGNNVVVFDNYPDDRVIAITTVWGYFSGPARTRELIEWDMLFNEKFTWGDAGNNLSVMDLQNIATHELGHSAGLGDLYETRCSAETMFGYSTEGEILKRDLNTGDIAGIKELYR